LAAEVHGQALTPARRAGARGGGGEMEDACRGDHSCVALTGCRGGRHERAATWGSWVQQCRRGSGRRPAPGNGVHQRCAVGQQRQEVLAPPHKRLHGRSIQGPARAGRDMLQGAQPAAGGGCQSAGVFHGC
jgi:hypothetical protein